MSTNKLKANEAHSSGNVGCEFIIVSYVTFDDENAAALGADHQSAVGPRVAAHDVVAKVWVKALRLPRGSLEQSGRGEAGGRVALDDRVQLQRLADAHELHLPRLFLAPRAPRRIGQHVAERPSVQHRLRDTVRSLDHTRSLTQNRLRGLRTILA